MVIANISQCLVKGIYSNIIMQDKTPRNEKGQAHGFWEVYRYKSNSLLYRGHIIYDKPLGYWEFYYPNNEPQVFCYLAT